MKPIEAKRKILRYSEGELRETEDSLVTEVPITVKVNERELVTMICTPEYIEDMVIGFLASEGIIRNIQDIDKLWLQEKEGFIHVKTKKNNPYYQNFQSKRYVTSCCGMSRQGFVFVNDALTAKKMEQINVVITPNDCIRLMKEMQDSADLFKQTGGVHYAALCSVNGLILSRKDIGRHNALDKIYGYCLKNEIPIKDKIIVFSGRISSEILLKAAKIGCEIILSKSAPTELAVELAEELGITAVGFVRNQSFNVYTRPERITFE